MAVSYELGTPVLAPEVCNHSGPSNLATEKNRRDDLSDGIERGRVLLLRAGVARALQLLVDSAPLACGASSGSGHLCPLIWANCQFAQIASLPQKEPLSRPQDDGCVPKTQHVNLSEVGKPK